ncbi:hypothetical protein M9H77_26701 [Catharanthus roseus]|uniref:Uncharacterized protein n=1 Tax=Catharanthus roseus TaxID=4058 RepID=A0ACC0AEN8_CATRO|nr:hypothetical protein M9H77_26701 [Catharanthus roseus]
MNARECIEEGFKMINDKIIAEVGPYYVDNSEKVNLLIEASRSAIFKTILQKRRRVVHVINGLLSGIPATPISRSKILSLLVVENLGTEVLSVDEHPVHHFIDELSPIVVLPPLIVGSSINQSMENIDEGIEEGSERV